VAVNWPDGFRSAGISCGIKEGGALDLGLLVADEPVEWAGVFTQNAAAAAPVIASRALSGKKVRGLVVNSGNANACTGSAGTQAVEETRSTLADVLGCGSDDLLIASTGPIGVKLPTEKITGALQALSGILTTQLESFAEAIMTTDTAMKTSASAAGAAEVVGVAKGAAMLAPNMATMLAFVATDAAIGGEQFEKIVSRVVDRTFNRISVDGCESTNDSVFVLASGLKEVEPEKLESSLLEVCGDLAEQMVLDAEGGTKMVRIRVEGADEEDAAVRFGKAIADSILWRSAVNGADPNWGRVLSALGSVDRELDLGDLKVSIGSETVFSDGEPTGDLAAAAAVMEARSYDVTCRVGGGPGEAEILTTDLSPDYVTLNAGGLT
jgi:glutamate N-acetyltransferase/amino-acid N-acetyltransferase